MMLINGNNFSGEGWRRLLLKMAGVETGHRDRTFLPRSAALPSTSEDQHPLKTGSLKEAQQYLLREGMAAWRGARSFAYLIDISDLLREVRRSNRLLASILQYWLKV